MNLTPLVVISLAVLGINVPLVVYNSYWLIKHSNRSQIRRFLKLMFTGKYEPPKGKSQK